MDGTVSCLAILTLFCRFSAPLGKVALAPGVEDKEIATLALRKVLPTVLGLLVSLQHPQAPGWDSHLRPWDSPGKNTGVGCHFLLQCMKVKSESEVSQSCPTLSDPMDCSLPGSSALPQPAPSRARTLEAGKPSSGKTCRFQTQFDKLPVTL